jgi:hypothetical protein
MNEPNPSEWVSDPWVYARVRRSVHQEAIEVSKRLHVGIGDAYAIGMKSLLTERFRLGPLAISDLARSNDNLEATLAELEKLLFEVHSAVALAEKYPLGAVEMLIQPMLRATPDTTKEDVPDAPPVGSS